jgi:hypothetical protein
MPGKKGPGIHKLEKMADGTGEQAENAQKALENMGFRMQMGSKSATNSDSAFAMKDESNMYMSALFHPADPPGHLHGGSTKFTIDDSGATLTNTDTKLEKIEQPKSSSTNIKIDDQGEDAFYNNLISSSKDMDAMVSQGINPNDRKAVLDYGNKKFEAMNQSSGGGSSTSLSIDKSEKKNTNTIGAIEAEGNREMDKFIGNINLQNYGTEMNAKRDSVATRNQVKMDLIKGTRDKSKVNLDMIDAISGYEGHKKANLVREEGNIPKVSSNVPKFQNHNFSMTSNERTGNNVVVSAPDQNGNVYQFPSGLGKVRTGTTPGTNRGDVYNHPAYGKDGKIEYKREGKLYIDSGTQMRMPDGALRYFNRNK